MGHKGYLRTGFALLLASALLGAASASGNPQIATEPPAEGVPVELPDGATPEAGKPIPDSKSIEAELTQADADKALDAMIVAARSTREGLRSVIAKAAFRSWSQRPDEKEPQLVTAGKFQLYYADGKCHLKFTHEKMLRRTIDVPQGVFRSKVPGEIDVFRNAAGEVVEVPARMADWKADNVFIISDGRTITSKVFTPRINPSGVRSESHPNFRDSCIRVADISCADPAYIAGGVGQLEAVIKNLGNEAIQMSGLPDGGFRASYRIKNAPQVRVELDAFAKDGFNVSASRVFNEGQELPATAQEVTWKKISDRWVASRLSSEHRYRGSNHLAYSKEVVIYYSLDVNPWVDPEAFMERSTNADWKPRASADE